MLPSWLTSMAQETGQVFLIVVGSLIVLWQAGAPEILLWMVSGLGALFITFEKVRAAIRPKRPDA